MGRGKAGLRLRVGSFRPGSKRDEILGIGG